MSASHKPVSVWDGMVRITHWVNAFAVTALIGLGSLIWGAKPLGLNKAALATLIDVHAAIGFAFAGSLIVRLALLFAGPEGPSHWRDILPLDASRRKELLATLRYYLTGFVGEPPVYFAHNALAGLAYAGFFALGVWQVISGSVMYLLGSGVEQAYAHVVGGVDGGQPHEELINLHRLGALLVLAFVFAHLFMLVLHELKETRGLASSMISGRKFFTEEELARMGRYTMKEVER